MGSFLGCIVGLFWAIQGVAWATKCFSLPMTSEAPYVLLVDVTTGAVLFEKNPDERLSPSSMTKIATAYLLFEALKNGDIALTDEILVSKNAASQEGSRMFLKPGQKVSYADLIPGIVTVSGNDACVAFGEAYAGSDKQCADIINDRMKELGAKDTHFINTSGLPSKEHWTTCRDLMTVALATLRDFPEEYKSYYGRRFFSFNGIQQYNRNALLRLGAADGMKTGWTEEAKHGIVASAQEGDRRVVLVINGLPTDVMRTEEAQRLLQWGKSFFDSVVLFEKGDKILEVPVFRKGSVALTTPCPVAFCLPKRARNKLKIVARYYGPLCAPIKKGQKVGVLVVSLPKYPPIEYPLVAAEDVDSPSLWSWVQGLFSAR